MKHMTCITSSQEKHRQIHFGLACMLLLVLIEMQSRGLIREPLASQLLSVNESNALQVLLPDAIDDDQPCNLVLTTNNDLRRLGSVIAQTEIDPSHPARPRWIAPSPRAPPVLS
jgi:hypothetical protein